MVFLYKTILYIMVTVFYYKNYGSFYGYYGFTTKTKVHFIVTMVLLQKPCLNQGYCSKNHGLFVVTMVLLQKP